MGGKTSLLHSFYEEDNLSRRSCCAGECVPFLIQKLRFAADGAGVSPTMAVFAGPLMGTHPGNFYWPDDIVGIYDTLRPSLIAYLASLGLKREEAEDTIQESFLRLAHHLSGRHEEQHMRSWLFRVAHNLAIDLFRSGAYRAVESSVDMTLVEEELSDSAPSPEENAICKELWRQTLQGIERLTPQQKYAVLLRAEGLRYREIATVLGVSIKRVAELVHRALVHLAGDQ
jgi:RNA polymerase sigma-70 factor (ECF subfamily)